MPMQYNTIQYTMQYKINILKYGKSTKIILFTKPNNICINVHYIYKYIFISHIYTLNIYIHVRLHTTYTLYIHVYKHIYIPNMHKFIFNIYTHNRERIIRFLKYQRILSLSFAITLIALVFRMWTTMRLRNVWKIVQSCLMQ